MEYADSCVTYLNITLTTIIIAKEKQRSLYTFSARHIVRSRTVPRSYEKLKQKDCCWLIDWLSKA